MEYILCGLFRDYIEIVFPHSLVRSSKSKGRDWDSGCRERERERFTGQGVGVRI